MLRFVRSPARRSPWATDDAIRTAAAAQTKDDVARATTATAAAETATAAAATAKPLQ